MQPQFEVSNSKNKDLVQQCTFQKVWKIALLNKKKFGFEHKKKSNSDLGFGPHYICFLPGWSGAEIKYTIYVVLPKRHINQFKLDQQSIQQALRAYCLNIYTVFEGDCDNDDECKGDFKCGTHNCLDMNPGSSFSPGADCCYDPNPNLPQVNIKFYDKIRSQH